MLRPFLALMGVTTIVACAPAERTAKIPVVEIPAAVPSEISDRKLHFTIVKPARAMTVGIKKGISACNVKVDHTTFVPTKLIEGLSSYYPKSTFSMNSDSSASAEAEARVMIEFKEPALRGFCNPLKCQMTAHLNARTTIARSSGAPVQKDVFITTNQEIIDGFGLGGWCRSVPELSTATLAEIATTSPQKIRAAVEAELNK